MFGALANDDSDDNSAATVTTQMAALTCQSQLAATTDANSSQQMDQYVQTLAHQQEQLHQNQHQIIKQLAALLFNQSVAGQGIKRQGHGPPPQAPFAPIQFGGNNFGSRGG
jgi:CII-binding regulator of phage lambda lysogenization HflD